MLHIIQNDPEVPIGNILDTLTVPFVIHHAYLGKLFPPLHNISALIVLGGSMGVNDLEKHPFLSDLKILIQQVVEAEIPYLGICLGGQLLASTFGAEVVSNRWEELGFSKVNLNAEGVADKLFNGIAENFTTFQWHHDSFDIPNKARLLASSSCCPNQAFRLGKCAYGLQFHPEVTEDIIRDWSAWNPITAAKVESLVADFHREEEMYNSISQQIIEKFIQLPFLK